LHHSIGLTLPAGAFLGSVISSTPLALATPEPNDPGARTANHSTMRSFDHFKHHLCCPSGQNPHRAFALRHVVRTESVAGGHP
jgi:hypothetical protein